jgi:hypothetical protein
MVIRKVFVVAAIFASAFGVAAVAEQADHGSLKRATMQSSDFPPGYETVMVIAEMKPGECPVAYSSRA